MAKANINNFDALYRRTIRGSGRTNSLVRIKLSPIGARKLRVLSHITVENQTSAYTKCRLGIDHGGVIHYVDELQTIAANELAVARSDVLLGEGDSFFSELTGTTTDDVLVMTCLGWTQKL